MTTSFERMNEQLIDALAADPSRVGGLVARHATRLIEEGGHRMRLLPAHFLFDRDDYLRLASAGTELLDIQTKIARHLVGSVGRDGLLELFDVPPEMRRFVNWEELLNPSTLVTRFDILQTDRDYLFCELNVDSCVAGAEVFDYMTDYFAELGVGVREVLGTRSPLEDLSNFVAAIALQRQAARIVILDLSASGGSAGKGYFSFQRMQQTLERAAHPLPVVLADETTYQSSWFEPGEARRTLVYRGFMMSEMTDGGQFLDQLLAAGTPVINTYESELRSNKQWFALFCDDSMGQLLTPEERALLAKYVPHTFSLGESDLDAILEHKNRYVFKEKQSFGGGGVHFGDEFTQTDLAALIHKGGAERWIVQNCVPTSVARIPNDEGLRRVAQELVFGLYSYGSFCNGMLLRPAPNPEFVNVTSGRAKLAWAACADARAAHEITNGLRRRD